MSDKDNITLPRELVQETLEALERYATDEAPEGWHAIAAITALRAALAAPEPEPVAWLWLNDGIPVNAFLSRGDADDPYWLDKGYSTAPLYAAPPAAAPRPEPVAWRPRLSPNFADHWSRPWNDGVPSVQTVDYWNHKGRGVEYAYAAPPAAAPRPEPEPVRHPGYVIGNHWLETAYERLCAGESEDAILEDYEVVREPRLRDLRRDAERLKAERDEQLRGLLLDIRKDSQSSHWHRDIVASMDALTALVSSAMDDWTAPAAAAVDASKQPATEPAIRAQEQEDKT